MTEKGTKRGAEQVRSRTQFPFLVLAERNLRSQRLYLIIEIATTDEQIVVSKEILMPKEVLKVNPSLFLRF